MSNPAVLEYTLLKGANSASTLPLSEEATSSAITRLRQFIWPEAAQPAAPLSPQDQHVSRPKLTQDVLQPLLNLLEQPDTPVISFFLSGALATALSLPDDEAARQVSKICDLIRYGTRAFIASGGSIELSQQVSFTGISQSRSGSDSDPVERPAKRHKLATSSTSTRVKRYKDLVIQRDRVCLVLNVGGIYENDVAHIIPFCLGETGSTTPQGASAGHPPPSEPGHFIYSRFMTSYFWKFVELFMGTEKADIIHRRFAQLDQVENMLYLAKNVHGLFGRGQLILVPDLTPDQELRYDPRSTLEYDVLVEFPQYRNRDTPILVRVISEGGIRRPEIIESGYRITLRTDNPSTRPLPNPALLLLHSMISRIISASGAASIYDDVVNYPESLEEKLEVCTNSADEETSNNWERSSWVEDWVTAIHIQNTPVYPIQNQTVYKSEEARPVHLVMAEKEEREVERGIISITRKRKIP